MVVDIMLNVLVISYHVCSVALVGVTRNGIKQHPLYMKFFKADLKKHCLVTINISPPTETRNDSATAAESAYNKLGSEIEMRRR